MVEVETVEVIRTQLKILCSIIGLKVDFADNTIEIIWKANPSIQRALAEFFEISNSFVKSSSIKG